MACPGISRNGRSGGAVVKVGDPLALGHRLSLVANGSSLIPMDGVSEVRLLIPTIKNIYN